MDNKNKPYSFMNIFDFCEDDLQLQKIIIPIIQRDYAQGREDADTERKRNKFVEALYNAVTQNPITLDFVYGDIDNEGNMTPLDGQQRLTTLFLLHWYAAKKEKIAREEWEFLKNFSYETRYSARNFCRLLVDFTPSFKRKLSDDIKNQTWFPLGWQKDPTISSMLVMLNAIDDKFRNIDGLWKSLKNGAITFYFLPIHNMGMTDELYIKMNSRGKPLTEFEQFKAELEKNIQAYNDQIAKRVIEEIDREWTDLLWKYRNGHKKTIDDNIIDDEFMCYFSFICDVIFYNKGDSAQNKSGDVFDILQKYFSKECGEIEESILTLEKFFNCWLNIPGQDSSAFLNDFISTEGHKEGKILVDYVDKEENIFSDCLHNYSDKDSCIRKSKFSLKEVVLLYAVTAYLQNINTITREQFIRRIRIVNNLIQNSEDEVSDRLKNNRMPAILKETYNIIRNGIIGEIPNSFNAHQMREEKEKMDFLISNPDKAEKLFTLEDHELLQGQISIVGLEHIDYVDRFFSLFECNLDLVDCALMAKGDYGQLEGNGWRYQYASAHSKSAWRNLFHKSDNKNFDNTKNILVALLNSREKFDNNLLQQIADDYLKECELKNEYPFSYYYIKYPEYRQSSVGKFSHDSNNPNNPYLFSVLKGERWSSSTYLPFLKVADDQHLSKDDRGQRLIYDDKYIVCTADSYLCKKGEDIIETIEIKQNNKGIDVEDRIIKLKNWLRRSAMNKLKIAIIGCRNMGQKHLKTLRENFADTVEIAGILTSSPESSARRAAELNVPYFTTLDDIDRNKIDAAIVSTPGPTHAKIGEKLLLRGIPCLIEKPLATTLDDCGKLIFAAKIGQSLIAAGHTENYNPAVIRLKEELHAPVTNIKAVRTSRHATNITGISAIQELMIHDLAIVYSLLGNDILTSSVKKRPDLSWENHAVVDMKYKNGASVQLEALREDREVERFMDIRDADGNIFHIDFMERRLLKNSQVLTEGGNSLQNELADFISCIKNGTTPSVGAREAAEILALCLRLESGMSV